MIFEIVPQYCNQLCRYSFKAFCQFSTINHYVVDRGGCKPNFNGFLT